MTRPVDDDARIDEAEPSGSWNRLGGQASDIQRARILTAMVAVVRERGYADASVGSVCARAKVSRRAFREVFDDPEDCFLTVLDGGARHVSDLISQAFDREASWLEGVRSALAALLSFFDSEPVLAHVLLVEASAAGSWARERREQHLAALTSMIEARWGGPADGHAHPLATAGVMASLLGVLHTQLVLGRPGPLVALLGPMMGLVTAPYLGHRGVTREIERGEALARDLLARRDHSQPGAADDGLEVPGLLLDPRAHRARRCMLYLAEHPGASNRQVGDGIGVTRQAQMSTLLTRLSKFGMLANQRAAPGHSNAWTLTPYGSQISQALAHAPSPRQPQDRTGRATPNHFHG